MKTILTSVLLLTLGYSTLAQEFNNEIKLNPTYLFSLNRIYPEITYERSISRKSAFGIALGVSIGSKDKYDYIDDLVDFDFSALPYYRFYFGKKRTNGFFLEANSLIFSRESSWEDSNEWGMGFGTAVGVKFSLNNSWSLDFVAGGGSVLNQNRGGQSNEWAITSFPDVYPRLGVSIAKRF